MAPLRQRVAATPLYRVLRPLARTADRLQWALERTRAYGRVLDVRRDRAYRAWRRRPAPGSPPHLVKQAIVRELAGDARLLVETGTLKGDMVRGMRSSFDRIVTIELSPTLAALAAERFAGDPGVTVVEGDSAACLPEVIRGLDEPAVFWLDGHFSGGPTARGPVDTPLRSELETVLANWVPGHVVLIDDARAFGSGDYPSFAEVEELARSRVPGVVVEVADDIVRIREAPPRQRGGATTS